MNRKSGAILSKAAQHPITIVRNDECFTLMRREDISRIVVEANYSKTLLEILNTAFLISNGKTVNTRSTYSWMNAFDQEEIQTLVAEVSDAYHSAAAMAKDWENLESVIHEWHESAIAILSADLAEAWQAPDDEMPLTPPAQS